MSASTLASTVGVHTSSCFVGNVASGCRRPATCRGRLKCSTWTFATVAAYFDLTRQHRPPPPGAPRAGPALIATCQWCVSAADRLRSGREHGHRLQLGERPCAHSAPPPAGDRGRPGGGGLARRRPAGRARTASGRQRNEVALCLEEVAPADGPHTAAGGGEVGRVATHGGLLGSGAADAAPPAAPPFHGVCRVRLRSCSARRCRSTCAVGRSTLGPDDLAAGLRTIRSWSGHTQAEVERRCGVRPGTVRTWESGLHVPQAAAAARLEQLFNLPAGTVRAARPDHAARSAPRRNG